MSGTRYGRAPAAHRQPADACSPQPTPTWRMVVRLLTSAARVLKRLTSVLRLAAVALTMAAWKEAPAGAAQERGARARGQVSRCTREPAGIARHASNGVSAWDA